MGGVIESPGNFRYKIEHRSADQFRRPPSWTATYKCNFPGPRNTLNNDVVLFAITKFCGQKHVKLGGDSGRPNFDHSQIQDWAVGFSEVEMKFSTFPRTWDGTCKAPLDLKEKKHEK